MKKGLLTLLMMIITALPAMAAPGNTSGPWGLDAGGFKNLSTALASPSTVGQTVVVSKPMAINNKTTDRAITVTAGGKINVGSGKTLAVNGPFSAGLYQVFTGSGSVLFGLTPDILQRVWFPADYDFTATIQSILTRAGSPKLSSGSFLTTGQLLVSLSDVYFSGQGKRSTQIVFAPTANNVTCLKVSAGASILALGGIKDMSFYSFDSAYVKTALNVVDAIGYNLDNVNISGSIVKNGTSTWSDDSNSSIGLKTNGRDTFSGSNLRITADYPIYLGVNPNNNLSTDHFNFHNIIISGNTHACITAQGGIYVSNMSFDGYQSWNMGVHGFELLPGNNVAKGYNLSFNNVRWEQGTLPTGSFCKIASNFGIKNIVVNNSYLGGNNGLYLRNVMTTLIIGSTYAGVAGDTALDADGTNDSIDIVGSSWNTGSTTTLLDMLMQRGVYQTAGGPLPSTGRFVATTSINKHYEAANTALQGTVTTLAMGEVMALSTTGTDKPVGLLTVIADRWIATFAFTGSSNSVILISNPSAIYSAVGGTASKLNVYWSAANSRYEIENNYSASIRVAYVLIGARTSVL